MKNIFWFICIIGPVLANTQPYTPANCSIEQFQFCNDSLKTIVRNFIIYEQKYCTEYSINWYIDIDVDQVSEHTFNIHIAPIPLEAKSAILGNYDKIAYMFYYGHYIFIEGDYEKTGFVNVTSQNRQFTYWKNKSPYIIYSWPEGYTEMIYEYDIVSKIFTLKECYRDEDLYIRQ